MQNHGISDICATFTGIHPGHLSIYLHVMSYNVQDEELYGNMMLPLLFWSHTKRRRHAWWVPLNVPTVNWTSFFSPVFCKDQIPYSFLLNRFTSFFLPFSQIKFQQKELSGLHCVKWIEVDMLSINQSFAFFRRIKMKKTETPLLKQQSTPCLKSKSTLLQKGKKSMGFNIREY